jgi:hypothetical protein
MKQVSRATGQEVSGLPETNTSSLAMTDPATLSLREMLRLLGVSSETLRDLVERGIAMPGEHEDTYQLETVTRYCKRLRELARVRHATA